MTEKAFSVRQARLSNGHGEAERESRNMKRAQKAAAHKERREKTGTAQRELQSAIEEAPSHAMLSGVFRHTPKSLRYQLFALSLPTAYQRGELCQAGALIERQNPVETGVALAASLSARTWTQHGPSAEGIDFVVRASDDMERDRAVYTVLRTLKEVIGQPYREIDPDTREADAQIEMLNMLRPIRGRPGDSLRLFRLEPEGIAHFAPLHGEHERRLAEFFAEHPLAPADIRELNMFLRSLPEHLAAAASVLLRRRMRGEIGVGPFWIAGEIFPPANDDDPRGPGCGDKAA